MVGCGNTLSPLWSYVRHVLCGRLGLCGNSADVAGVNYSGGNKMSGLAGIRFDKLALGTVYRLRWDELL